MLMPGDDFYLKAFDDLSTTRSFGMALGPIPWHLIMQYGLWSGLDQDMITPFVQIIRKMDSSFLDWNEKELGRKTEGKGLGNKVVQR